MSSIFNLPLFNKNVLEVINLLFRDFYIKDIIGYEEIEQVSLLDELAHCSIDVIIDLISISNKIDVESSIKLLEDVLKNNDITYVLKELSIALIGKAVEDEKEQVNKKEYSSYTEILLDFYRQIQRVDNLMLSDFLNMTTKMMYKYCDGLNERYIVSLNKSMQDHFNEACILSGVVFGSLKEVPQFDMDGSIHKKTLREKIRERQLQIANA